LFINGFEFERAHAITLLGFMIEFNLDLNKDYLNKNALFFLYTSLIVPYLTYCIEVRKCLQNIHKPIYSYRKERLELLVEVYRDPTNPLLTL